MGLDLYCAGASVYVGSYRMVHRVRRYWLNAARLYLKKIVSGDLDTLSHVFNKEEAVLCSSFLERWSDDLYLDLDANEIASLKPFGLTGLAIWISHSDCDGYLSPDESSDILRTLKNIYPFIDKTCPVDHLISKNPTHGYRNYYLYNVFWKSVASSENVEFC